jgi:fumarate reductase subunit C
MSDYPSYTEYHPRWYRPRMSTYWWMKRGAYIAFILRELSSVFVAWFVLFLLMLIHAVSQGKAEYEQFLSWAAHPVVVAVNAVSLLLVVFHSVTWFNLAPQALVMRVRGKRVPGVWIAGANYAAWAVVSAVLAWILLRWV